MAKATTTRTRRVSAAVTPWEGGDGWASSEAARGKPRRARRKEVGRTRGRKARGAGDGAGVGGPAAARVRTRDARSRRGATRPPSRVATARRARGAREGRAIDAAIGSIGAARASVATDAAIGAPRRREDGRARAEVWRPSEATGIVGTSRVRGFPSGEDDDGARRAEVYQGEPAHPTLPKTARIQHRALDDVRTPGRRPTSPDASRRHRRASTFTHAARRSVHRARTRGFGLDASPRGIQIAFHIT